MADRLPALTMCLLVFVGACSANGPVSSMSSTTTQSVAGPVTTSSSTYAVTTTTPVGPIVFEEVVIRTRPDGSIQNGELRLPSNVDGAPLVVAFHGAAASTDSVALLADHLAVSGAVVLSAGTFIDDAVGPSSIPRVFPVALDDAACAVAFAHEHAAEWGADAKRLVVVGHAAGGTVGAFAALSPESADSSCAADPHAVVGFVGLSTNPAATSPIGSDFGFVEGDPALEELADIRRLYGSNSALEFVLLTMVSDRLAPVEGIRDFVGSMEEAGYRIRLIELEGSSHTILTDPRSRAGSVASAELLDVLGLP